jgi:hypothetical protein
MVLTKKSIADFLPISLHLHLPPSPIPLTFFSPHPQSPCHEFFLLDKVRRSAGNYILSTPFSMIESGSKIHSIFVPLLNLTGQRKMNEGESLGIGIGIDIQFCFDPPHSLYVFCPAQKQTRTQVELSCEVILNFG